MQNELAVRVFDGSEHLTKQNDASLDAELASITPSGQRFAFDIFKRQIGLSFRRQTGVVEPGNVGVHQAAQNVAFAGEAFGQLALAQGAVRQLERDLALERAIDALGQPDLTHAAASEFAQQAVRTNRVIRLEVRQVSDRPWRSKFRSYLENIAGLSRSLFR